MLHYYSGYQTDLNFAKNICAQIDSAMPTLQLPRSNPFVFTNGMYMAHLSTMSDHTL